MFLNFMSVLRRFCISEFWIGLLKRKTFLMCADRPGQPEHLSVWKGQLGDDWSTTAVLQAGLGVLLVPFSQCTSLATSDSRLFLHSMLQCRSGSSRKFSVLHASVPEWPQITLFQGEGASEASFSDHKVFLEFSTVA